MAVFVALLGTFNPVAAPALEECSLIAPDQRKQLGLPPKAPCEPMDPAKIDAIAAGMSGHGIETPPPDTRTLPELLCDEANTVIAMAESVLRGEYPKGSGIPEHHDPRMIEHRLYSSQRYLPAGASEAALRLSRLARELRTEAAQWGAPCETTTETTPP